MWCWPKMGRLPRVALQLSVDNVLEEGGFQFIKFHGPCDLSTVVVPPVSLIPVAIVFASLSYTGLSLSFAGDWSCARLMNQLRSEYCGMLRNDLGRMTSH